MDEFRGLEMEKRSNPRLFYFVGVAGAVYRVEALSMHICTHQCTYRTTMLLISGPAEASFFIYKFY